MRPRDDLAELSAYLPAALPPGVHLHANESPYPAPPEIVDEIADEIRRLRLNRYPDHAATALRAELAAYAGVDPSWVWVGTGSNEILLDACLAYGGAGRTALLFEPTYSMHHRQAIVAGTRTLVCPRRPDFTIDVGEAVATIERERPDVVFVCTPNNPTGTATPPDEVRAIASAADGLVIVDEAYFEFCGQTFVRDLDAFGNVLVVRTLSKAFRLAGVRLGYAIAPPDVLEPLLKVRMPYAQSSLAQAAATVAVRRRERLLARVPDIVIERERLSIDLSARFEVFPSEANFVFFRSGDDGKLYGELYRRGIVIRPFPAVPGLRVTAGTPDENDAFLKAVRDLA